MASERERSLPVAVVQAMPVLPDTTDAVEQICESIVDASLHGARLVVFPATCIPGYPEWVWTTPPGEESAQRERHAGFLASALPVPSNATDRLCRVARRARIDVVVGITERTVVGAPLYNTTLFIDARGQLVGAHRALVVAGAERLVWTPGGGDTLGVHRLSCATVGALIGAELYHPLLRYALYRWGATIFVAVGLGHGALWSATLRHIAREGGLPVIGCGYPLDVEQRSMQPDAPEQEASAAGRAERQIVAADGAVIAGARDEPVLYAEIAPRHASDVRRAFDLTGYGARPDIFQLTIHHQTTEIIQGPAAGTASTRIQAGL